ADRSKRLRQVGLGHGTWPASGKRGRSFAVLVDDGRDRGPRGRSRSRMMPAHQPGTYNDRARAAWPLQVFRQTVPHGDESRTSSEGVMPPNEQPLLRPTEISP